MASAVNITRSKRLKDIGLRLKKVRCSQNMSTGEMARRLYLSRQILSTLEGGRKIPTGPVLLLLETLFLVDKHWLLTGEGDMFLNKGVNKKTGAIDENIIGLLDGYRSLSKEGKEMLFTTLKAFLLLEEREV
jgi:transcriptional regulator with XRE-family HTH domain